MNLLNNNSLSLNENPTMPNVDGVVSLSGSHEKVPHVVIGNMTVNHVSKPESAEGLREHFEKIRQDIAL